MDEYSYNHLEFVRHHLHESKISHQHIEQEGEVDGRQYASIVQIEIAGPSPRHISFYFKANGILCHVSPTLSYVRG